MSPSGDEYALASRQHVSVFDLRSGEQLHVLEHPEGPPLAVEYADASRIVTGAEDAALRVWDSHSGRCIVTAASAHSRRVKALSVLTGAPGTATYTIVSASTDGSVKVCSRGGA